MGSQPRVMHVANKTLNTGELVRTRLNAIPDKTVNSGIQTDMTNGELQCD